MSPLVSPDQDTAVNDITPTRPQNRPEPSTPPKAVAQHYFSARPEVTEERRQLRIRLAGHEVSVWTANGVFSTDRLDLGTSVLLREAPQPPREGTFLDLGCGWGPIALTLAMHSPEATVWAVDVNERALALTSDNAQSLGLTHVRTALPEQVDKEATFDVIWSNPPIRIGKAALHTLLSTWLPRLAPGGTAYLVVQKNLGADSLQSWLNGTLSSSYHVDRYASAKGFRVLRVRREPNDSWIDPA